LSRGKEASTRGRTADPCAFCGVRVTRGRSTEGKEETCGPSLCVHCDAGDSIQFSLRETFELARPFARSCWRRPGIVDARSRLRFGVESRRR
jgi:hypothetical protein